MPSSEAPSATLRRVAEPLLTSPQISSNRHSRPRQRATIYAMAQPSRPLRGAVDSLGWRVASDVSATFGGLPHVERTLNWVRIAARFPVRILLEAPPDDLMRFGGHGRDRDR
jgi:multidrug resistance efflux pump